MIISCCVGGFPAASEILLEVPADKTAVIETASAWFQGEPGLVPRLDISAAILGESSSLHFVELTSQGTATAPFRPDVHRSIFSGTQTVRLYAPPGSQVRANVFIPLIIEGDPTVQIVGRVNVTGYFVDTP